MMQRLTALLCSTRSVVVAGLCGPLGWATTPLASRRGRMVAIGGSALLFGVLATLTICGVALRILSGSYLTAGALVFLANSSEHFVHGAFGKYAGTALSVVMTWAIALLLSAAALRRVATPTRVPSVTSRRLLFFS